ncbi:hypothetical protein BC937DRAFT_93670 [Endogone sp. FLAS-F59071]|nr:hypothetical protein BC937DRAFT_93670 [Endogone sp. FLAS-F59071]|eukprot:RUS14537.1 hypothetical protein BC937DRAFT_93670 [Endogone sp. FLAS-F59071]
MRRLYNLASGLELKPDEKEKKIHYGFTPFFFGFLLHDHRSNPETVGLSGATILRLFYISTIVVRMFTSRAATEPQSHVNDTKSLCGKHCKPVTDCRQRDAVPTFTQWFRFGSDNILTECQDVTWENSSIVVNYINPAPFAICTSIKHSPI